MSCDFRLIDFNYVFQSQTDIFVSSEDPDFPRENLKKFTRAKTFRTSSVAGTQYVTFDLKTIEEIDSIVLFFNPVTGPNFSPSAVVSIQASATNIWTAPPVDVVLTIDEAKNVASHFFTTDQTYRYWRLKMVDPMNLDGFLEVPKLVIGKKILLTRIPEIGFEFSVEDQSKIQQTPYGHKYFDVYPNIKKLSFDYKMLEYQNLKLLSDSFDMVGRVAPVVVAVDSNETFFDKDDFLIYGTYMSQFKAGQIFRTYFKSQIEIEEII